MILHRMKSIPFYNMVVDPNLIHLYCSYRFPLHMPFQSPMHKNSFHVAHNCASDTDYQCDRNVYEILLFRGYILHEVECYLKMFLQHQEQYRCDYNL